MEDFIVGFLAATLRIATPLIFGTLGELFCERAGILNLGIEGTMFFGAFVGFAVAAKTGSLMIGLLAAILCGILAGLLMSYLSVVLGVNQHVSGLGITLLLTALSMFGFGLVFGANRVLPSIDSFPQIKLLGDIPILGTIFTQYGLTYVAILLIPICAWILYR
ncbi:MAG: ABC transporter permease, partial [Candidatus Omnitrophica bacterium]|nr:ABC transporter permease [Candidatus Omnitrophota bacterium]